tara:strand:+ start:268 stop:777 length:510 start_codon:yes stop_codon:yes gene_type:complete
LGDALLGSLGLGVDPLVVLDEVAGVGVEAIVLAEKLLCESEIGRGIVSGFAILRTRRKGGAAVAFLRTVDCDDGRGGDDEEYHDEGGVALAGLALGPGIVNDLLVGAKKVAHHGVGRHRSRRRCARRVVVHDRWFNCIITERVKSAHVFFASYSFFRGNCLPCAEVLEI